MQTMSKGALKPKILEYLRAVEQSGEVIVVTDHGKPVIRFSRYTDARPVDELFADLRAKARGMDEALNPTTDEWAET